MYLLRLVWVPVPAARSWARPNRQKRPFDLFSETGPRDNERMVPLRAEAIGCRRCPHYRNQTHPNCQNEFKCSNLDALAGNPLPSVSDGSPPSGKGRGGFPHQTLALGDNGGSQCWVMGLVA